MWLNKFITMIKELMLTLDLDLRYLISSSICGMAYSGKLQIQGAPTCDHCKKFKKLHEIDTILVNKGAA